MKMTYRVRMLSSPSLKCSRVVSSSFTWRRRRGEEEQNEKKEKEKKEMEEK